MDIKTLFDKQPDEIIAYFKAKKNAKSWDWDDIWQEAHHKAFTVAKCMKADILQDIRDEVEKAIADGIPFAAFKKNLTPILQKKGWWGKKELVNPKTGEVQSVQLGSVRRLETIYRTNMRTAFMTGRYQSMTANAKNKPYWRYVCRMKPTSRDEHKALHNKVFRYDDPIWETMYPPNGWNCGCRVEPMDKEDIEYFNTHLPKWQSKLTIESSRGKLAKQEKVVSVRGGEAKLQTVTGYRDPKTGKIISPATGWNYNVGKTAWEPDLKKYDKEIREVLIKELSLLKTPEVKISFSDREEEKSANIPFISKQIKSAFQEIGDPNPPEVVFNTEVFKRQYGERYVEIPAAYSKTSGVIFINKDADLFHNEATLVKGMVKQTTEKTFSSNKKHHFVIHEYFHAQLDKKNPALYQKLSKHIFTQEEGEIIKQNLSDYATKNGLEFTAEYETREFFHLPIDAKIKKIYDKLMKGG